MKVAATKQCPFFLMPHGSTSWDVWKMLYIVLHNYIHWMWLKPYKSEIEFGQLLAQTFCHLR